MTLLLTIVAWLLSIFCGILVALWFYARWNYGVLERLGFPVVKPFLFLGSNYDDSYVHCHLRDLERLNTHGMVYGVYDGRRPQIYISDPKILRLITTADFEHFRNHDFSAVLGPAFTSDSLIANILDVLSDEKWKTVRASLTPIFTSSKIRQLGVIVQEKSDVYADHLTTQTQDGLISRINLREYAAPMIIEILAKAFCGIGVSNAMEKDNAFVTQMKASLFDDMPSQDWKFLIPKILPFVMKLMPGIPDQENAMKFFTDLLENILQAREKSGEEGMDAAKTLVDMRKKCRNDPKYKELGISETVVMAQAWEFFAAGYLGLRDNFEFFMYEVANNDKVQDKVFLEIQSALEKTDGELSAETFREMPYTTACLMETTRLYTAFSRPERICNKDWEHGGLRIPKGMQIMIPLYALHFNPEFYPEPNKFDPTRFLGAKKEERDPFTYMTFGHGPRGCIGQRFAMNMLKIMVCCHLRKFRVQKRKDTRCTAKIGSSLVNNYEPIYLDLIKR